MNGKDILEVTLMSLKLPYVKEYKFSEKRKFRFDFAIPSMMIGLEYEGLFSAKSRHTTITGYTADTEKYNLAVIEGWKVLRYTAKTAGQLLTDLEKLKKG